ncbi:MAG: hypothetical protein PVI92_11030 [Chromatiales bacterium]
MVRTILVISSLFVSTLLFAADHVWVDEPEELKWQLSADTGKVYFRNLDEFTSGTYENNFGGCCYSYWVDTTTDSGKSLWSVILAHIAANRPFYITKADASEEGHISHVGVW